MEDDSRHNLGWWWLSEHNHINSFNKSPVLLNIRWFKVHLTKVPYISVLTSTLTLTVFMLWTHLMAYEHVDSTCDACKLTYMKPCMCHRMYTDNSNIPLSPVHFPPSIILIYHKRPTKIMSKVPMWRGVKIKCCLKTLQKLAWKLQKCHTKLLKWSKWAWGWQKCPTKMSYKIDFYGTMIFGSRRTSA
jgi:hypothetical protein